jgi:membrane protein YqaA with SNARE-associated domain
MTVTNPAFDSDKMRMIFGFILLIALVVLIGVVAIGHVEEKTSYGLTPIIMALATVAGGFSNWAFDSTANASDKLRMIFGFILLLSLVGLVLTIGILKVEKETSAGLIPLITMLATLSGSFTNWAFGRLTTKVG